LIVTKSEVVSKAARINLFGALLLDQITNDAPDFAIKTTIRAYIVAFKALYKECELCYPGEYHMDSDILSAKCVGDNTRNIKDLALMVSDLAWTCSSSIICAATEMPGAEPIKSSEIRHYLSLGIEYFFKISTYYGVDDKPYINKGGHVNPARWN
jgi:hypothetical protein